MSTRPHLPPTATLSTLPPPPSTSFLSQRLLEKQHEWEGVALLRAASGAMLARVEEMAGGADVMADGGKAIGSVLANWPNVFRIISLCAATQARKQEEGQAREEEAEAEALPRLVRLQVAGLRSEEGRGA